MQRPTSLTVIGWLLIVFASFGLISQLTMGSNHLAEQALAESPVPASVHMAVGILGALISAASGFGILKGLNWSRYLYIGWSIFALAFALATIPFTAMLLLSVIIIGIFAFILFRPAANAWFTRSAAAASK